MLDTSYYTDVIAYYTGPIFQFFSFRYFNFAIDGIEFENCFTVTNKYNDEVRNDKWKWMQSWTTWEGSWAFQRCAIWQQH